MAQGLEVLTGLDKLNINQCEALAKELSLVHSGGRQNVIRFDLCGPRGAKPARWLDPWMGLLQLDGDKGFITVGQLQFASDLWCENVRAEPAEI